MFLRPIALLFAGGCLAALVGCSGRAGPPIKIAEVKGRVTLAGKPVSRVTRSFKPVNQGIEDVCAVENGNYQTHLAAGEYKISIEPAHGGTRVPARYRKPETSGLVYVADGSATEKDWELR